MMFSPLVERSIELAAEWHDQTYRKSRWRAEAFEVPEGYGPARVPVIAHLTAVALTVQKAGWDEETVAAAFLHDILEDRNRFEDHMAEASLRTLMGERVARIVLGVTEPKFDEGGLPLPWQIRKQTYLDNLRQAPVESLAVSLADKLHNTWTMAQGLETGTDIFSSGPGRKGLSAGPNEQVWFYESVIDLSMEADHPDLTGLRSELRDAVDRFGRLAGVR